ncbi:hypothetical protein [Cellulomonas rhizosphaerae]|uniref:hypothetical protein n=1 Tax=Cellulomonas rhizosphaerae TaxID=2293719 RepID=UPI0018F78937|nr:hypothetical protein [Cellulomonas rhizosphaerae]
MRIRSTKPEFWRSERVASVTWDARLVLKGLESYVDDNGVGKDDLALIVGDLFQRDLVREPSRTLARVSEALTELETAGLLWRYDGAGTPLLYVAFWESFQRIDKPGKGRLPRPDGTTEYGSSEIRETLASPRETSRALAPGTGEQGNRGTGQKDSPSPAPPATPRATPITHGFDQFWEQYPRKVGKQAARTAYGKATRTVTPAKLLAAAHRYAQDPNLPEKEFIPHPSTWLNEGRWDDEPLPARSTGPGGARPTGVSAWDRSYTRGPA